MANVSGTKITDPLKGVDVQEDSERMPPALGPEVTAKSPTELELQASADVVDEDLKKQSQKETKREKLFPVRLLKDYRPIGDFEIGQPNPETGKPYREPTEEERQKVKAGTDILLPLEEAKRAIALKIGERNDPIK